ncbi:MAG: hypothetical protein AAF108_01365 [Planctomycetota bacterium]
MTGTRLTIRVPADYLLPRDVCSYGYFLLAPNHWDPADQTFRTTLLLEGGATTAVIAQRLARRGSSLTARFDRPLSRPEQADARAQIARMLNLAQDVDEIRAFHRVDPRWRRSGRGRLMRSVSLFEDVIKTVTSCNVAWPNTINMNRNFCEVLGKRSPSGYFAFPSPVKLARTRPGTLRGRCRVGYRDERLIALAKLFAEGRIDEAWLASPDTPNDDAFAFLLSLPGIGPYAAGNIMQLLGRYSRLALDTESVRHARTVLGMRGESASIMKRLARHYEPFGEHKFRSYWFELWTDYERKRGPAHTWDRETTGKTFTASRL